MTILKNILHYIVLAGVFVLPFVPLIVSTSLFFPFITGKAFFFRIVVEIIVAAWAILAVVDSKYRPKRSPILWAVVALVGVSTLAAVLGANLYHSFWSNFERSEGLLTYFHLLAYFVVLISVLQTEKLWRWFLNISLGISIIVAILALKQWLAASGGGFRADVTFGNPIYLAVYALFNFFLALFMLVRSSERWQKYVYGAVALIAAFSLYLTATRGAGLGLIAGVLVGTLLVALFEREKRQLRLWAAGILVAVVLVVGGFWLMKDSTFIQKNPVLSRFANISLQDGTTRDRLIVWNMGLKGFKERPILGWGPENFNLVFNKYYDPTLYGAESWFDRTHNILIDWLVHAGVIGLLAYLGLFIVAAYCVWRKTSWKIIEKSVILGLLAAYLVQNVVVFDNLVSYLLFFGLLAYIHFSGNSKQLENKSSKIETVSPWWSALPVIIALVAGIYYLNIKPMTAAGELVQAISFYPDQVKSQEALDLYVQQKEDLFKQVFAADTFANGEASEQLLTFTSRLIQSPQVSDARKQELVNFSGAQMLAQIARTPDDARYQLFFGSFLTSIGDAKDGVKYLDAARALSPDKQQIIFAQVQAYYQIGDKKKAQELAKEAYDLNPNVDDAKKILEQVKK